MNKWLKELVDYQSDGSLKWRKRRELSRTDKTFNTKLSGNKVGSVTKTGYLETKIKGKSSKTNDLPKGIFYDRRGRYRVQISCNKKLYWGGYHDDISEAVEACNNLRMKLHKDFRKE